jgi:hypothetical protein
MPLHLRPRTAFFIFLDEFSRLHRHEYNKYSELTASASETWRDLDNDIKDNYIEMARVEKEMLSRRTV